MSDEVFPDVLGLTAKIVSAHIGKNKVETGGLPALIQAVYRSLATAAEAEVPTVAQEPAVPVKRSVFPDYIVCLEDGAKLKILKRHLKTRYDMTPEQYRAKWNLPSSYPMIAPNYTKRRSALAKKTGLESRRPSGMESTAREPVTPVLPAKRARGLKGK